MTTINEARENRTHLMNIQDMLTVARQHTDQHEILGEPERVIRVSAAYYGGLNVGDVARNFDRVRGQ